MFPAFCWRETHIARRISLYPFQNTEPVTLQRKTTIYVFFWKKTLGSFPPLASWGHVLGMLQFASLILGAPNWPLDSDVTSPVLHTDYPYLRPAALVLDQLTNSSGPLAPSSITCLSSVPYPISPFDITRTDPIPPWLFRGVRSDHHSIFTKWHQFHL